MLRGGDTLDHRRDAEACAERSDGAYLMAIGERAATLWTRDPEMALRTTTKGQMQIANATGMPLGFRQVLVS